MPCYLISLFNENPDQPGAFRSFRERRIDLMLTHGGEIIALFRPEAETGGGPGEIHILAFPSEAARRAFRDDMAGPALADLQRLAVAHFEEYRSGVLIPVESAAATRLVTQRPSLSDFHPGETINEQLQLDFPDPRETGLHPAQRQEKLETMTRDVRSSTQRKLAGLVEKWGQAQDRRVIFAHTYLLMTGNMLAAVERGDFHDRDWVKRLLDAFADRYFEALKLFEQADFSAPLVWRVAFEVAGNEQAFVIQHLLLGVNAHISYDLAVALTTVLKDDWHTMDAGQRRRRYEDHTRVNEVIAATSDETQELVIARYSPVLDRLMQSTREFDDILVSSLIGTWREQAWQYAVAWLEAESWDEKHAVLQRAEYTTLRRADVIMLRQGPMRMKNF